MRTLLGFERLEDRLTPSTVVVDQLLGPNFTIQAGIDQAHPGDIVRVDAGLYGGAVVNKALTLEGLPGAVIQSPLLMGGVAIGLLVSGQGTTVSSLAIQGIHGALGSIGVCCYPGSQAVLAGLTISDVSGGYAYGVWVHESTATLAGCKIEGVIGAAVKIGGVAVTYATIDGCDLSGTMAVQVSGYSQVSGKGNILRGNFGVFVDEYFIGALSVWESDFARATAPAVNQADRGIILEYDWWGGPPPVLAQIDNMNPLAEAP